MTRGIGLAMFPEGTRSPDTRLLRFKKGGFHLALETGYPILPVSIQNSGKLFGKKSLLPRPGVITVVVHPPIPTEERSREEMPDLMREVRTALLSALPDARAGEAEVDRGGEESSQT
jgi:1-acyl-sn-glycerol-3-phosphate acyltransferase